MRELPSGTRKTGEGFDQQTPLFSNAPTHSYRKCKSKQQDTVFTHGVDTDDMMDNHTSAFERGNRKSLC